MLRRRTGIFLTAVGLIVLAACEFEDLIESNPDAFQIVLEPRTAELEALGDTIRLSAELETSDGLLRPRAKITWRSLDPEIATVSSSGLVRAVAVGTARIEASVSSLAETATITVRQKVASLSAIPAGAPAGGAPQEEAVVEPGDTVRFVAIARDRNGHEIPDVAVTWASLAPAVVSIDEGGLATAHQKGEAKIVASAGDIADTVTVVVRQEVVVARIEITPRRDTLDAIGSTLQLKATAYTADGSVVSGVQVEWTALNPNIATVDNMGRVTAKAVGTALIVATAVCCGQADTAGIEVRQVVASLSLDRATGAIGIGETLKLTATAADANGNPIPGAKISWSSSDEAVASVDGSGLVRGIAPGAATITAESGSKRAEAHITVNGGGGGGGGGGGTASLVNECAQPGDGWIWCDDFDQDRLNRYFEYNDRGGSFVRVANVGIDGSGGMRARFAAGQVNAGDLKLAFGKTPSSYMRAVDAGTANYREIYWRFYLRNAPGWTGGGGDKLARAVVFAGENWSEALIAHVWSGGSGNNYLVIDPASGTDEQGNVRTTGYNDFANLRWLGAKTSSTPIFDAAHVGEWHCIETHVRLNDPGQSNGVFELWINGKLEARATGLNWVGNYSAYGINALFLENYWNAGSPRQQERYFDNLVVSTKPIGCGGGGSGGGGSGGGGGSVPAPVATVTVSPSSGTIEVDGTLQLTATLKDAAGNTLTGRVVEWSSSNTAVATVTSSGLVRGVAEGSATITARSEGKSGSATVVVTRGSTVQPVLVEDFSTYRSTAEFLADPRSIYEDYGDINVSRMAIDFGVGYGSSDRSLRYTYPARGSVGTDYTISRSIDIPDVTEVWIEAVVRFDPHFSIDAGVNNIGKALKLLHVGICCGVAGRFGLNFENGDNGQLNAEGPNDSYESLYIRGSVRPKNMFDGQWHVVRYHVRLGSTDMHEFWVDGVYQGQRTGNTRASRLTSIALGKNINQGPLREQSLWWGRIAVWTSDPGWR